MGPFGHVKKSSKYVSVMASLRKGIIKMQLGFEHWPNKMRIRMRVSRKNRMRTKGSNPEKKLLPFGHCPKVAFTTPPLVLHTFGVTFA